MKNKTYLAISALLLTACGSGNTAPHSASPQSGSSPTSVIEARAMAEATGKIPKLDRTTSILGVDANANGVRDDIDVWIDSRPDTPAQKAAMKGFSASLNSEMALDVSNPGAVQAVGDAGSTALSCLFDVYGVDRGAEIMREVNKMTLNTRERFNAYMNADRAMSGHSFKIANRGATCAP